MFNVLVMRFGNGKDAMKNDLSKSPEIAAILLAAKRIEQRRNKSFKVDEARMEEFKSLLDQDNIFESSSDDFIGPQQETLHT
jgi:hypothetical protein